MAIDPLPSVTPSGHNHILHHNALHSWYDQWIFTDISRMYAPSDFLPSTGGTRTVSHRRVAGNMTLVSAPFTNVDNTLDIQMNAQVNDWVSYEISGEWWQDSTEGYLDVATTVSGNPVNYLSSGTDTPYAIGVATWRGFSGVPTMISGASYYKLQANDITNGVVTLRLKYATADGLTTKLLYASVDTVPLIVTARNLGQ